jgi:hypothetical protein
MGTAASFLPGATYPEREEPREGRLERLVTGLRYFTGGMRSGEQRLSRIVAATEQAAAGLGEVTGQELLGADIPRAHQARAADVALPAARAKRESAARALGLRH